MIIQVMSWTLRIYIEANLILLTPTVISSRYTTPNDSFIHSRLASRIKRSQATNGGILLLCWS